MGAFFLIRNNCEIDRSAVEDVFKKKGFSKPALKRNLGKWELWLYGKQIVESHNYVEDENGYAVYATGTLVYNGLGYSESLTKLLTDFKTRSVTNETLLGNFCLLFWDGQRITFLNDELNVQHIFIDDKRSRISTSFLALLSSNIKTTRINKTAFYEKLATGYILSPDTLVEGIYQINDQLKTRLNEDSQEILWLGSWQGTNSDYYFHDKSYQNSIVRQIEVAKSYFEQVDNIHNKYHGELGLSSGYDSRLLLADGCRFLSSPLAIHTHSTIGVHDFERSIAEKIANLKKLQIRSVETKRIEDQEPDRVQEILLEGLYFFDARCSYDMGAYSETYTGSYKKRVLGENKLSFNGLGGEIFRNYLFDSKHQFNTSEWMKSHIYYYYAEEAINDPELFHQIHSNVISKIEKKLNIDIHQKMSFFQSRRYYSEVRTAECDGVNHNAQNQIGFYLTPFMEPMVFREALMATPYIGGHGKYQAELIRLTDPILASVQSHYGFTFDRIPLTYSISRFVKGHIPYRVLNMCHAYLKKRGRGQDLLQSYIIFKKRNDYIRTIEKVFADYFPEFNWQIAMCDNIQKATTIFLASFLHEFSNKLTL